MRLLLAVLFATIALGCNNMTVTASSLNIRKSASTSAAIVGSVTKGTIVCVDPVNSSWVKYGTKGYLSASYLKAVPTSTTPTTPTPSSCTTMYATASLNIRKGAGTNTAVVRTIPAGTSVCVVSTSGDWSKLSDNTFAHKNYLTSNKPSTSTTPTQTGNGIPAESVRPVATTAKGAKLIYYNQADSRWAKKTYGTNTYQASACGPCAMAMVVATLADRKADCVTLGQYSVSKGHRVSGGTANAFFCDAANKYGLKCKFTTNTDEVVEALKKDNTYVIARMGCCYWTQGGHFITLHSTSGNLIYAHDPGGRARTQRTIDLFKKERKDYHIINK